MASHRASLLLCHRRGSTNYDAEHYVRVLRENFASRLARAFTPGDFAALFADPDQGALFPVTFGEIRAVLKQLS